MSNLTTILQEILGSKARVAVLRNVINVPGISARNIETRSGMSWGAIRPAVNHLVSMGVLMQERDGWSNHLYLNREHLLALSIKRLFNEEKRLVATLFKQIRKKLEEIDKIDIEGVVSLILDHDEMLLYVIIQEGGIAHDVLRSLDDLSVFYRFGIVEKTVEEFMQIQDEREPFLSVVTGEKPPFKSIEQKLCFFDFK